MKRYLVSVCVALGLSLAVACGGGGPRLTELETVMAGPLQVVLLSDHAALRHGKDSFVLEFRSNPGGAPVDVGTVKATASMPMPGMPMFGTIDVRRTNVTGRYEATGEFSMAGRWRLTVEWDGPAGRGSVNFSGAVQ